MAENRDEFRGSKRVIEEGEPRNSKHFKTSQQTDDGVMNEEVWMIRLALPDDSHDLHIIRSTLASLGSHPQRVQMAIDTLVNPTNPRLSCTRQLRSEVNRVRDCIPDIDIDFLQKRICKDTNCGQRSLDFDALVLDLLENGYRSSNITDKVAGEEIEHARHFARFSERRPSARSQPTADPHVADLGFNRQAEDRDVRVIEARSRDELRTCQCCFDEELLLDEIEICSEGHVFCRQCIRQSVQTRLGMNQVYHYCLAKGCDSQYDTGALRRVLSSDTLRHCLRLIQLDDLKTVNIPNLVSCPRCDYCAIMDDAACTVLYCMNPACLHQSCRLCGEDDHQPLSCDQIESGTEKHMRAYMERCMSEAMIRTCHRCGKRYIKLTGCNHITCSCGAHECYICRAPITGFEHFTSNGSCPANSDMGALHAKEMMEALEQARQSYIAAHPGTEQLVLRYDPVAHLIQPITDQDSDYYVDEEYEPDEYEPDEYEEEFDDEWL